MNEPNITREIEEGQLWSLVHENGETVVAHILQKFYDTTWRLRFEDEGRVLRLWTCGYIKSAMRLDKPNMLKIIDNIKEGELWKLTHKNKETVIVRIVRKFYDQHCTRVHFLDDRNNARTWECHNIYGAEKLDFLEPPTETPKEEHHMNAELFCKNTMAFINSVYKGHRVLVEFNVFHAQEKTKDGDPSMLMECSWSNLVK